MMVKLVNTPIAFFAMLGSDISDWRETVSAVVRVVGDADADVSA